MDQVMAAGNEGGDTEGSGMLYRVQQMDTGCKGLFATRDIQQGEVIVTEAPLFETNTGSFYNKELMADPAYRGLQRQLRGFVQSHGHLHGAEKYPPEVQSCMDQILEISCEHAAAALPEEVLPITHYRLAAGSLSARCTVSGWPGR